MSALPACVPFRITGNGVGQGRYDIHDPLDTVGVSGRIRRIVLREEAGGLATACDLYLLHNKQPSNVAIASVPEENITVEASGIVLTASATALSLDTPIDMEPAFRGSLSVVANVTAATGAWALTGYIETEQAK